MHASLVCLIALGLACARVGDAAPESQAGPDPAPGLIEQEPARIEPAPEPEPEPPNGFEPAVRGLRSGGR